MSVGLPTASPGDVATTLLQGDQWGWIWCFGDELLLLLGRLVGQTWWSQPSPSVPGVLLCILALNLCGQDPLATAGELCTPRETRGSCGEWGKGGVVQQGLCPCPLQAVFCRMELH